MRMWLKSACVVLAWSMVPFMLVAAVTHGSALPSGPGEHPHAEQYRDHLDQYAARRRPGDGAHPHSRYVVQDGDTLSGIAARFAVRGGWPALYAANRAVIGSDPGTIRPGIVLVLPGPAAGPGHGRGRGHPVRDRGPVCRARWLAGAVRG